MAKGRKFTISRSERFLGSYGFAGDNFPAKDDDGGELREDDLWSMVDDFVHAAGTGAGDYHSIDGAWSPRAAVGSGVMGRRRTVLPAGGGLSVAFDDDQVGKAAAAPRIIHQFRTGGDGFGSPRGGRHVATSAPVNVPDWSKIYRVDSVESIHDSDDGTDDQDSGGMIPPHEYLARSHRSAAKSVFEGVGRTLKGRDMSRVRDAVWSQTGFDG